ncbi:MAG: M15 family metallopeptidase [Clostridia bacterium]|nr:M15 family metallopeptidase [Clostridia bacterium]
MAKKIIPRVIAILLASALLFALTYLIAYKITKNKYVTQKAAEATTVQFADETTPPETQAPTTEAPTDAPEQPADETTEAPALWDDSVLPEPTVITMPTDETWSLVLINKFYKMTDAYEPFLNTALDDSAVYLDERVADAFKTMYDAAYSDGVTLTLAAGYVSLDRQTRNFTKQVNALMEQGLSEEQAQARATFTVLPAGCSESNYGLAVEIGWPDADFADAPAYKWLRANAAKFGFIERYTADKEDITHFNAEPWHWRFVGVEAARAMLESGQCLEEYAGKVN